MENFNAEKWAVITPIMGAANCDIATMKAAVFTVDLEVFEAACAAATDCTFNQADYLPYAFGFLWQEGEQLCENRGPYILNKTDSTLPFGGLYWYHEPLATTD